MARMSVKQQLCIGLGLTCAFMILETIAGIFAGSLAMLGDAAHMMTDAVSFAASLGAVYASERLPTARMTYGLGRIEVLSALASTLGIWLVTGMLVSEAVSRIILYSHGEAKPVHGRTMMLLGIFGVLVNVVLAYVLGGEGGACVEGLGWKDREGAKVGKYFS